MSNRDDHILLADVMVAIEKIQRYTAGYDKDRFLADERTIDAVVRNLEIVGEAVRQISDAFKQDHVTIPWHQMAGLRNRIVHDYFGLDLDIIWHVVSNDLPVLKLQLLSL
jgi:uncharacterized protein with HEPN domain